MDVKQFGRMASGRGFIAALDQSGGSTPKALKGYGIEPSAYQSDEEMYDLVQEMRSRIIRDEAFTSSRILGAILFEKTMDRKIEDMFTADYLWQRKGIVPFLKVDKGLADENDGVRLMKPIPQLDELLKRARERNIFGTKMRSVITEASQTGIRSIVDQQFAVGRKIAAAGLVPILEPEVDIHSPSKKEAEAILLEELKLHLQWEEPAVKLMFKLTIPTVAGAYSCLMEDPRVVRVVALSGGYSRQEADELLKQNPGLIASFSRALLSDLRAGQTDEEFSAALGAAVQEIYAASIV